MARCGWNLSWNGGTPRAAVRKEREAIPELCRSGVLCHIGGERPQQARQIFTKCRFHDAEQRFNEVLQRRFPAEAGPSSFWPHAVLFLITFAQFDELTQPLAAAF